MLKWEDELALALSGLQVSRPVRTVVTFDDGEEHMCACGDTDEHWENPQRLSRVLKRLKVAN